MHIMAISNQKGGVGKTTTAINVASGLSAAGYKVLLIDLDPQGNASTGLGIEVSSRDKTSYDLLFESVSFAEIVKETSFKNLSVIPANPDLASVDISIATRADRSFLLRNALINNKNYDFVLIDCPPSLSLLTVNALVASNSVLIPLQGEFFALEGLSQLMMTIRDIRKGVNPDLRIEGVVMTMMDSRNRLSQQVETDVRNNLGDLVFSTIVPRNVRVSEAPSHGLPVLIYDPNSKGAEAYRNLINEILSRRNAA